MAESESWRELEARFRALQPLGDDGLRAHWISTAWNEARDHWYISGSQDERVHTFFKWAAEHAALKLGHPGGRTAPFFWLDLLKRDSPNFRGGIEISSRDPDGPQLHHESGVINRVCEASADYCLKLENEDLATGRRYVDSQPQPAVERKARPNPTNDRERFVMPILDKKGWSILDWANESGVDSHTANDYLKGKTKPYPSTRKKLADALGVGAEGLPE